MRIRQYPPSGNLSKAWFPIHWQLNHKRSPWFWTYRDRTLTCLWARLRRTWTCNCSTSMLREGRRGPDWKNQPLTYKGKNTEHFIP
jgi:hypothetical protein